MPLFVPIILAVWLLVIVVAMLMCISARRTDAELLQSELAPVVELGSALRHHSAA